MYNFNKANRLFESEELDEMLENLCDIEEGEDEFIDEEDDNLNEDELFEDEINEATTTEQMSEEDLKIESLKIATNIAKLMSDVTTEDIIEIADTVSGFIRNHEIGSINSEKESDEDTEKSDDTIDFDLEEPEENKEEEK